MVPPGAGVKDNLRGQGPGTRDQGAGKLKTGAPEPEKPPFLNASKERLGALFASVVKDPVPMGRKSWKIFSWKTRHLASL